MQCWISGPSSQKKIDIKKQRAYPETLSKTCSGGQPPSGIFFCENRIYARELPGTRKGRDGLQAIETAHALFYGEVVMEKAILFDDVFEAGQMLKTMGHLIFAMSLSEAKLSAQDMENIGGFLDYFGERIKEISYEEGNELEARQDQESVTNRKIEELAANVNEIRESLGR